MCQGPKRKEFFDKVEKCEELENVYEFEFEVDTEFDSDFDTDFDIPYEIIEQNVEQQNVEQDYIFDNMDIFIEMLDEMYIIENGENGRENLVNYITNKN